MIKSVVKTWVHENSSRFWRVWLAFVGVTLALVAVSMVFIDQEFARHFGSPEMARVWLFHREITEIGAAEVYVVLALMGLLIARFRKKAAYLLACMVTSGIAVHIFKFSIGRARAHKAPDHDPFTFDPFNIHHHWQSLPSGHSQTLFTVATVVAYIFPRSTPYVFLLALYLAFTRAVTLAHFVSDVWAGAAFGLLFTVLTLRILVQKYGS